MKLIEPAAKRLASDRLQHTLDRFKNLLHIGKPDNHSEETIITQFLRGLDNRFVMLRNIQLERLGSPFPPIIIGPTGLAVLNISHEKGFFKAKEDSWWKMDKTTQRFNPARLNLVKQSQEYAKKLATILDVRGKSHPEVTPVLVFSDPGVHIETSAPAIRIVLMDGVDSLISSFLNSEEVLAPVEVNSLSDTLELIANPEKAIPVGEGEDFFGQDLVVPEKKATPKLPSISIPTEAPLSRVEEKLQFSTGQWVILAILLVLTIVVLVGAILFALSIF